MKALNIPDYSSQLNQDLASAEREGNRLDEKYKDKLDRLRDAIKTRCKEKEAASDLLFIDCDAADHRIPGLACWKMISTCPWSEEDCIIYHFCSRHTLSNDPMRGLQDLVKSLIWQLLKKTDIKIKSSIFRELQKDAGVSNLRILRRLLKEYFKQKGDWILACVIDGAECFDTREWRGEMEAVFKLLCEICPEEIFKVFVTCPRENVVIHGDKSLTSFMFWDENLKRYVVEST